MRSLLLLAPLWASAALASEPYAVVKGPKGEVKAPLFSAAHESTPIAKVGDEVVTLRELSQALSVVHTAHTPGAKAAGTDFTPALNRLIGTRLVLIEAHEMGIDDLPEVKEDMKTFAAANLRAMVQRAVTKGAKPEPAEVDRLFKDAVREWRVKSALFPKEEEAKAAAAELKAGKPFDQVVARAVAAKKAFGGKDVQALSAKKQVLPQVMAAVEGLKVGAVSPVIQVDKGWTILKLEAIAYPKDPAARAEAERQALAAKKLAILRKYYEQLVKKDATIDEPLFKSLDFEAKEPGFEKLKKDPRVVATVHGEGDITVAEVCTALESAFFHGIPEAISQKKVNKRAREALDSLLSKKLVALEARRRGLEKAQEHKLALQDHRAEVVFGLFVNKAIEPGINVMESEGMKYYEEHKAEYMFPGFYTLSSLAFETPQGAQSAAEKLKSGADFKFLKANLGGQLPEARRGIDFDGNTLTAKSLPKELLGALQGARNGDVRIYAAQGGSYVVVVKQVTEPAPQPYPEVRADILFKLREKKVSQALEEWIAKLRKAREVQVYITRIAI